MRDESRSSLSVARYVARVTGLATWLFAVWILLTWSPFTVELELFGAGFAVAIACAIAPFGGVVPPWRLLDPRRLVALAALMAETLTRILRANLGLARRIWSPKLRLESGMVVVPTEARSPGALAAVGLISSLIVDNQIVDLDRRLHTLQYHAVSVPEGGAGRRRAAINGPVERMIRPLAGSRR